MTLFCIVSTLLSDDMRPVAATLFMPGSEAREELRVSPPQSGSTVREGQSSLNILWVYPGQARPRSYTLSLGDTPA